MKTKKKIPIIIGIIIVILLLIGMFFILKDSNSVFAIINNIFKSEKKNQIELKNQFEQNKQNQQIQQNKQNNNSDSDIIKRYFLSKVELSENRYSPVLIKCLVDKQGKQLYNQWSGIYYPDNSPYEVAIIKVELDKKTSLNLSDACFIKEIITEEDWKMVKSKYNFSKEKFGK